MYVPARGKSKVKSLLTYSPSLFIFLCYTQPELTLLKVMWLPETYFNFSSARLSYHALLLTTLVQLNSYFLPKFSH